VTLVFNGFNDRTAEAVLREESEVRASGVTVEVGAMTFIIQNDQAILIKILLLKGNQHKQMCGCVTDRPGARFV
jgi:hypothetical protein